MRLAAQKKMGFYPAPPAAVLYACRYLRNSEGNYAILDPCAGEAEAIGIIADFLEVEPQSVYAIELEENRADKVHGRLPDSQVLAPASFFGCHVSPKSMSLIWLNPPFDQSDGGGRVETEFLRRATDLLMPEGILAFVVPETQVPKAERHGGPYCDIGRHLMEWYTNIKVVAFPKDARPYREVVIFAKRRHQAEPFYSVQWKNIQAKPGTIYDLPESDGPRVFRKTEPTEAELQALLGRSKLRKHLETAPTMTVERPPLPLGTGHVALLLASGHLDGVVHPEGELPHLVRGTARKVEYVDSVDETEDSDGVVTTKTVMKERIDLIVRTIGLDGTISTLVSGGPQGQSQAETAESSTAVAEPDDEWKVISTYTRQQAIADGTLIDVSKMAKEAGIKFPVAVTSAVWAQYVTVPDGVQCQDEQGRLWDILWMLSVSIRKANTDCIRYGVHVRNDNRERTPPLVQLKAICGPGDDAEPVITVMLPEED